jgi:hypothetical protein
MPLQYGQRISHTIHTTLTLWEPWPHNHKMLCVTEQYHTR